MKGDICGICHDDLIPPEFLGDDEDVDEAAKAAAFAQVQYCKWGCGKGIHRECMRQWIARSRNECIYCQAWWTGA